MYHREENVYAAVYLYDSELLLCTSDLITNTERVKCNSLVSSPSFALVRILEGSPRVSLCTSIFCSKVSLHAMRGIMIYIGTYLCMILT